MKLLAFAASLRRDSSNRKLIALAADFARRGGAEVDLAEFREFDMPLYDADVQASEGIPSGAQELGRRVGASDGLLIASPEYNYSLPGTLKNAIDWVSRLKPVPLRGRSGFLMSASNSLVGGIRGLWQLRIPLEGLGVLLHPNMYALPSASQAFDQQGQLKEAERQQRLEKMLEGYLGVARKLAG
ncbi:MAG: NAD(P)H-dependent oxidoreductase [Gemmatimonadales bacterium]|nr:NAD(P)H-dependent oxidoreductase [Gemmatimonadales bacterium]